MSEGLACSQRNMLLLPFRQYLAESKRLSNHRAKGLGPSSDFPRVHFGWQRSPWQTRANIIIALQRPSPLVHFAWKSRGNKQAPKAQHWCEIWEQEFAQARSNHPWWCCTRKMEIHLRHTSGSATQEQTILPLQWPRYSNSHCFLAGQGAKRFTGPWPRTA